MWLKKAALVSLTVATATPLLSPSVQAQIQEKAKSNTASPNQAANKDGATSSSWVVACAEAEGGLACRAAQSAFYRQGNRNVRVSAVMEISPETKKPSLKLQLPLGVFLPSGVSVRIGDQAAKALAFQSCNPNGCVAEHFPSGAEIAALKQGSQLELAVRTPDKSSFTFNVPATGFEAAYGKVVGN